MIQRIGNTIGIAASSLLWYSLYVTTPVFAVVLGSGVIWAVWAHRRRLRLTERDRLLADCDNQHAAWKAGDDAIAFFGHHQPANVA